LYLSRNSTCNNEKRKRWEGKHGRSTLFILLIFKRQR
jgi:hypothetical protein